MIYVCVIIIIWVVIFSHPADFTPVCTTELGRIALQQPNFKKRNTKLLAYSVDKLKDHVDWVNDIKSYCLMNPGAFPYPIVADPDRKLAVQLDMIDEESKDDPETVQTIRALYIISPDQRLRLSMQYPTSTGRNVDEILRAIDSLQLVDRRPEIATPANWMPGEEVMILPTVKEEDIPKLFPGGVNRVSVPSGKGYIRTATNY
ncbi:PREDICTED: peroxiredoxin-6-like isoform X2 [Vollenhovia emeryi]|uniref:peroxiredoxin-6-like isoform X2 n=1 Tax=Vollenhovia emeryi TaxID=411798 RepID=UPI0005F4F699|nr:PREDICTED: peroxiredoxin-6-like isoform X2 [Vollenhovia emeryi]